MSVLMAYHTKTLHAKKQLVNAINTLNKAQCQLVTYFYLSSHSFVLLGGNILHNPRINCLKSWVRLWLFEGKSRANEQVIGHFRVPKNLTFKTRLSAKPLTWKLFLITMQIKLIFTTKISHLASFWKWDFLELGNSLLKWERIMY